MVRELFARQASRPIGLRPGYTCCMQCMLPIVNYRVILKEEAYGKRQPYLVIQKRPLFVPCLIQMRRNSSNAGSFPVQCVKQHVTTIENPCQLPCPAFPFFFFLEPNGRTHRCNGSHGFRLVRC